MSEEEQKEDTNNEEQQEDEVDEVVEEIEEETSGGLLTNYSPSAVLAGGLLLGLALGLITGYTLTAVGPGEAQQANPAQVQEDVETLITQGQEMEGLTVHEPEIRHGMYYVTVDLEMDDGNETIEEQETFYVSIDGELLFPVMPELGSPLEISEQVQAIEELPDEPIQPENGEELPGDEEPEDDE